MSNTNVPWNKGRVGVYSEESLAKMSQSRLGIIPSNKKEWKERTCPVCCKRFFQPFKQRKYRACNIKCGSKLRNNIRTPEYKEKLRQRGIERGFPAQHRPSKPQLEVYNIVKEVYPTATLEYTVKTLTTHRYIDIAIPEQKLGIEYDGSYWHQDTEKDQKRDEELREVGWNIVHVTSTEEVKTWLSQE